MARGTSCVTPLAHNHGMPEVPPPIELRGLSDEVTNRLREKPWGPKTLSFLRTARVQIRSAASPPEDELRLAETAGYALREALDSVTKASEPAPAGLPEVLDAWDRYVRERGQGEVEEIARASFEEVIERNRERRNRDSDRERRLIGQLERDTGLSRFAGRKDPVDEYKRLRQCANTQTHGDALLGDVVDLYNDSLVLFDDSSCRQRLAMTDSSPSLRCEPSRRQMSTSWKFKSRRMHMTSALFSNIESAEWIEPLWSRAHQPPRADEPWP